MDIREDFRKLKVYQVVEVIIEAIKAYQKSYNTIHEYTLDRMVAASCRVKQNIAAGSMTTSKKVKMDTHLYGVAMDNVHQLKKIFGDFLAARGAEVWTAENFKAEVIRKLAYVDDNTYTVYKQYIEKTSPNDAANAIVCLIHQAEFLLEKLMQEKK